MATEYKLSYTASEINEKLGKVNELSEEIVEYENKLNILTPDDFDGTDTEKLQQCFDTLKDTGGIIHINRTLSLNANITIEHNSNNNQKIVVIGIGKQPCINMGECCFVGTSHSTGGVTFQNIIFTGTEKLVDATYLIRLTFDNCTIANFVNVFESVETGTGFLELGYMQTLYLTNCLIRSVSGYIFKTPKNTSAFLYDCKVLSCVIEWCGGVAWCGGMQGCSISHNCIEGMNEDLFYVYCHICQCTIAENYFEANAGRLINLKNPTDGTSLDAYYVLTIANNNFIPIEERTTAEILLPTTISAYSRILIYGNKMSANSVVPLAETNATTLQTEVTCFGNYGNITDPNNVIIKDLVTYIATLKSKVASLDGLIANLPYNEELINNETLIDNVAEVVKTEVPLVKTAEQPDFAESVDDMTNTSKVYVMPDMSMWAYMTKKADTLTADYFAVMSVVNADGGATISDNGRGSRIATKNLLSLTDKKLSVSCPSPYQYFVYYYTGETVDTYIGKTSWKSGNIDDISTDVVASGTSSGAKYCRISLRDSTNTNADLYGRLDEFMENITIKQGSDTKIWSDTNQKYNQPADYEDEILELKTAVAELQSKLN